MATLDDYLKKNEQLLVQRSSDTLILFNLESGEYYALNEVGCRVWELCDGTRRVADLVSVLSREFDAPPKTIEADVLELLDDLIHEKMVRKDEPVAESSAPSV